MAKRYNPPPGWQVPAEGWRPSFAWKPDPSWPPAPVGWVFWVEAPAVAVDAPRRVNRTLIGMAGVVVGAAVLGTLIAVGAVSWAFGSDRAGPTDVALAVSSRSEATPPAASLFAPPAPTTSPAPVRPKPAKAVAPARRVAKPVAVRVPANPVKPARPIKKKPAPPAAPPAPTPPPPTSHHHHHRHHQDPGPGFPGFYWPW